MRWLAAAALLLVAGGCRRQEAHPLRVSLPDAGLQHRERLARAAWRSDGAQPLIRPFEEDPEFVTEPVPIDRTPDGCGILLEDTTGARGSGPARASLITPSGSSRLGQWQPSPDVSGDLFALEVSFSPDGRWVAVSRLAVGIGIGEKVVEVAGVEVRPAPPCP